jgi:hypothetical protein
MPPYKATAVPSHNILKFLVFVSFAASRKPLSWEGQPHFLRERSYGGVTILRAFRPEGQA